MLVSLNALTAGIAALQPWPMKLLVDHALRPGKGGRALPHVIQTALAGVTPAGLVAVAAVATLGLFFISSFVSAGLAWTWAVAGRRMVYDVAADLFRRLQRRSLLTHAERLGECVATITCSSPDGAWSAGDPSRDCSA